MGVEFTTARSGDEFRNSSKRCRTQGRASMGARAPGKVDLSGLEAVFVEVHRHVVEFVEGR